LKVPSNVKIAMQCFENFGGGIPPLVARLTLTMILYEDMKPIEHVLVHPRCQCCHRFLCKN